MICPSCRSGKNGHIHNGRQNYQCRECKREFAGTPENRQISGGQKSLIKRLLPERISLRGICRVMNVSVIWLPGFFRRITDGIPDDMGAVKPEKGGISTGIDEIWSYTGKKKNRRWIRPAFDRATGQTAGFHIGGREREDARKLRKPLPGVYRQCAVCYTGFWEAYEEVIPECRHRAAGKETGQTNHIGENRLYFAPAAFQAGQKDSFLF